MSGPLGIVDWGIGGLDLYRRLRAAGSPRDVIYWSDAGAPPYGTLPAQTLGRRLDAVVERLVSEGCGQVVIACNAASTVLTDDNAWSPPTDCAVIGVIEPTLRAIERRGLDAVAVIGGRRTVESSAYANPLRAAGCRVVQRVAQPLSALVEQGLTEGPAVDDCLREILAPLHDQEHLVLACTHYVAALPAIRRRLPRLRSVIDPTEQTLAWVVRHFGVDHGDGTARFLTTGPVQAMHEAARRAFGVALPAVESIESASLGFKNA